MTAAAPTRPGHATLEDLLAIPEGKRRHEIIDGELVEKEAATGEHGLAQTSLVRHLGPPFHRRIGGPRGPGGWWFLSEVEIVFAPKQIYRPDVVGWRRERSPKAPTGTPITLVPDWVCEILSTNRTLDTVKKKRAYHQAKVPHYWLLDPIEGSLSVQRWTPDGYLEVLVAERHERVAPEPFQALEFPVGAFLGDDDDDESAP